MKQLDVNPGIFYNKIHSEGELLFEHVDGWDEDDNHYDYYGFDDALNECDDDGAELHEYGMAYYYENDKLYQINVYLPNNEGVGARVLEEDDKEEIKEVLTILFNQYEINPDNPFEDEDMLGYLIDDKPWAKKYLSLFKN